jgi:hypothetical protein
MFLTTVLLITSNFIADRPIPQTPEELTTTVETAFANVYYFVGSVGAFCLTSTEQSTAACSYVCCT